MGNVERRIVEAAARLLGAGQKVVTEDEMLAAALAGDPQSRTRPSWNFAIERLVRRGLLASQWRDGQRIGYTLTRKAYHELADSNQSTQS